jgi:uncharacterized protein (TIGR04255 family)
VTRPDHLPDFSNPPIDEVAIGFQFDRVEGFSDVHAGLYWQRVRETYKKTQTRPRGEMPIEELGTAWSLGGLPAFELLGPNASMANRTWLVTEDDIGLIQIQDNQFIRNWRRRESEYPHLDEQIDEFWSAWGEFCQLLSDERFEQPRIRQLEVSYFNWISPPESTWFSLSEALVLDIPSLGREPGRLRLATSYLDHDEQGTPQARFQVEIQPALKDEGGLPVAGYRLVLSYKAPEPTTDRESLNALIRRGREVIVLSFVELTTTEAHRHWGRIK